MQLLLLRLLLILLVTFILNKCTNSTEIMSFDFQQQNECFSEGAQQGQQTPSDNNDDVYMVRHGARVDRESHHWTPRKGRARDDAHLSAGGLQSSHQLAERFKDIPLTHIVSSPYLRCIQTMAPIALAKKIPIKVEPGICEVLSTRYPPGFWNAEQLSNEFPIDLSYTPVTAKQHLQREYSDGDAAERSRQVANTLRNRLQGPILFCGHGASCLGISEAFGGSGYVGYSSFSHYVLNANDEWKVKTFNDVSHLSKELQKQSLASAW